MVPKFSLIGIGMWLGTIMWFNVWFVIWPNQQKALNIGGKYPDLRGAGKGRGGQDRPACSPASTPCCRFPCCSAWWRHRICYLIGDACHELREPPGRAGGSFFDMRMTILFEACAADGACRRSRPLFREPVRAAARRRSYLFALYAFNDEVARVAEKVREPMLGAIRLEWWRETPRAPRRESARRTMWRGAGRAVRDRRSAHWLCSRR